MSDLNEIKRIEQNTDEYLNSIKNYIKSTIKHEDNLDTVKEIIYAVFNDDYLSKYPEDGELFNVMDTNDFHYWCEQNIEGYNGYETEIDIKYCCHIQDVK